MNQIIMNDEDIAEFLQDVISDIKTASEIMVDPQGGIRHTRIFKSQYLLGKIVGELCTMIARLKTHTGVYRTRREYLKTLERERLCRDDDRYFKNLNAQREAMAAEQKLSTASDTTQDSS